MLIAVSPEDWSVYVFDSVEDANGGYLEQIDVENREFVFVDHLGIELEPVFGEPVKKKIFWFIPTTFPGPFSFRSTGEKKDDIIERFAAGKVKFERSTPTIRSLSDLRHAAPELFTR
jgi:hypothetical protein